MHIGTLKGGELSISLRIDLNSSSLKSFGTGTYKDLQKGYPFTLSEVHMFTNTFS